MSIFKDNVRGLENRTSVDFKKNVLDLGNRLSGEKPSIEEQAQALDEYSRQRNKILRDNQAKRGGFDEFGRKVSEGTSIKYVDLLAKQQGKDVASFTQSPMVEFRKKQERNRNFASRFALTDGDIKKEVNDDILPKLAKEIGLIAPRVLFGSGTDSKLSGNSFADEIKSGGAVGFLYQESLKTDDEIKSERFDKLISIGTPPERAFEIAQKWQDGKNAVSDLPLSTTEEERKAMRNYTGWRAGFLALELADLLLIGKPINAALKSTSRVRKLSLFKEMSQATNARDAREILRIMHPQLAEKEGSEEIIKIAQAAGKKDSWKKIIADNKRIDEILNTVDEQKKVETTAAQRIFFENGIPILRGSNNANLQDTLKFRKTQRDILSGGAKRADGTQGFFTPERIESSRLSNDAIFESEKKVGTISFKQTPDEKINVFIPNTGFSGSLLKQGARVALTEQAVKEGLQAESVRMLKALPDDLVRLPDGTFIYAPREIIGKNLEPTLQGIRAGKAKKVADAERKLQEGELKNQRDILAREQGNKRRREDVSEKAQEKAVRENALKEERIAQSKKIIESAPKLKDDAIARSVTERTTKTEELVTTARASRQEFSAAKKNLKKADTAITKKVAELTKAVRARNRKAIEAFKKTRAFKKLTPKQKEKALKKFRKDGDALIAKLQKEKNALNTQRNLAKEKLQEASSKVIDTKTEKIRKAELASQAKASKIKEIAKIDSELNNAKQGLLNDGIEVVKPAKTKPAVKSTTPDTTPTTTDVIYREVIKEVTKTAKEAEIKQIKAIETGKGAEIKSAISKDIKQMLTGELKAAGLTAKEADQLVNPIHRVAANQDQIDNAIERVVKSPIDEYNKFLEWTGNADNSSQAALELALLRHPLIASDPQKVVMIIKKSIGQTTRIAQELQARNILSKNDPHAILRQMYEFQADLIKQNSAGVTAETKQIMDDLGNQLANLKVADVDETIAIITEKTCK